MTKWLFLHELDDVSDERAERIARKLAGRLDACLVLLHVASDDGTTHTDFAGTRARLRRFAEGLEVPTRVSLARGPADALVQAVAEHARCGVVVVGSSIYDVVDGVFQWSGSIDESADELDDVAP